MVLAIIVGMFLISVIAIIIYEFVNANIIECGLGNGDWAEVFAKSFISFIICFLLIPLIGSPVYFVGATSEQKIIDTKNVDLIALNDTSTIGGSFYLNCGSVDGKMEYRYLYDTDKGIAQKSANANSSYIKEYSEISVPYVEVRTTIPENGFLAWLSGYKGEEYIFHLPKGSIKVDYNVNLKGD